MFILNILGQVAVVILIALLLARRECSLLLPPAVDCLEAATTAWAIEQHGVKLATHHLRSARLEPRRLGHNVPVRQGDGLALRPEVGPAASRQRLLTSEQLAQVRILARK